MQYEFLKQGLDLLGKSHFNKTWPDESVKVMAAEVADVNDKAMVSTIARIRVELSPSTFPALKRIIDILREEQVKLNLANSPEEPKSRQFNDSHPVIDRKAIGTMGFDSLRLIDGLLDGKLTKENFVEGMMVFDKKYPCVGWSSEAGKMAAHFSREERYQEEERARYSDA